jgi:hypothetical protein
MVSWDDVAVISVHYTHSACDAAGRIYEPSNGAGGFLILLMLATRAAAICIHCYGVVIFL